MKSCTCISEHSVVFPIPYMNCLTKRSHSTRTWSTQLLWQYCGLLTWARTTVLVPPFFFNGKDNISFSFSDFSFLVPQFSLRTSETLGMLLQIYGISHCWRLERDCAWLENLILVHVLVSHFCPWQVVGFPNGTKFYSASPIMILHRN